MFAEAGMMKVLAFIGFLVTHSSYTDVKALNPNDLFCVATAVYHEARGEPITGQIAVAYTIKNRVGSADFPDTACGVVYDEKHAVQFTGIKKVKPNYDSAAWEQAVEVAVLSWIGFVDDPTKGARFYYNPKKVEKPSWTRIKIAAKIGNHTFFDKS
jgi:N-acetylmuramoyl-L-alanine amidase